MPPSPRWLMLRATNLRGCPDGRDKKFEQQAVAALHRFRDAWDGSSPQDVVDAEIRTIVETLVPTQSAGSCTEVIQARRALVAGLGLVLLQQVTGQPSVLYYQELIFRTAGFGDLASSASVIVGGAKLIATLVSVTQVCGGEVTDG